MRRLLASTRDRLLSDDAALLAATWNDPQAVARVRELFGSPIKSARPAARRPSTRWWQPATRRSRAWPAQLLAAEPACPVELRAAAIGLAGPRSMPRGWPTSCWPTIDRLEPELRPKADRAA